LSHKLPFLNNTRVVAIATHRILSASLDILTAAGTTTRLETMDTLVRSRKTTSSTMTISAKNNEKIVSTGSDWVGCLHTSEASNLRGLTVRTIVDIDEVSVGFEVEGEEIQLNSWELSLELIFLLL
jgi:hypothetical protein